MDLYAKKDQSAAQKILLVILEVLLIAASYWILLEGGYNDLFASCNPVRGNTARHLLLFVFNLVVFGRMCITFFYLVKRRIPFAFALYYIGFALLGYSTDRPLDFIDGMAVLLFIGGGYAEYRFRTDAGQLEKKSRK